MRQQRGGVLFEAVGQEERHTAGRQHLHHLMDHALRHGQRPVPDVERQEQLGHGVDGHPHPARRACQALEGLGLADLPGLDGTQQGIEFVQLDLGDVHVVQHIL